MTWPLCRAISDLRNSVLFGEAVVLLPPLCVCCGGLRAGGLGIPPENKNKRVYSVTPGNIRSALYLAVFCWREEVSGRCKFAPVYFQGCISRWKRCCFLQQLEKPLYVWNWGCKGPFWKCQELCYCCIRDCLSVLIYEKSAYLQYLWSSL